jgi:polar amino acid transport system substrate-binding protein
MMTKKIIFIFLLFVITLNAQSNDKITLYLDWLNQFQFAGYYVAKENGYYDASGLDVDIKEFNYNSNILKNLMSEEASYGVGKSSLIVDKFDGNNIVLLSTIFQTSPMVLISLKSSNIETPKDLKDKKVMITDDAISSATINSMIVSQGVKLNEITVQKHSFDINDLINKKTDSMACFLSNEPYVLEKLNIKYNILNPNNYNFDFYEGILYTSEKELLNNPSRVQNFNKASLKGWEYAFNHIEETAKLIHEKYNSQNKSLDSLIYEGKVLKTLSKIDEGILGKIDTKTIDEIKRFYSFLGLNKKNSTFETNSIILNKTNIVLNDNEIKYLENNNFALLVEDNNIPFSFKLTNKLNGIEIDFWNLISKKLSKSFNIQEIMQDKIFNIFSNSINTKFVYSFEKKNNKGYLLTEPLAQIPIALATKNNKNFVTNLSSLKDSQIGVLENLKITSVLQKEYPNIKFININSTDEGISKLEKNEIFGLIDNIYTISHKINKNHNNLKINSLINHKLNLYIQVEEKDFIFINILNNTINRFSKEDIDTILNNYQFILYPKEIDFYFITKIIIPFILLIAIFIYFNIKLKKEIKRRKEIELQLSELANKDSLTNISNRRKIQEICELEIARVKRYESKLSIIFFDVNNFKYINDSFGHHLGDEVLVKITSLLEKNLRETDSIGRWGGDEFLIIVPETDLFQCTNIVIDLEEKLKTIEFSESINVTCSFGIAVYEENDDLDSLLKKADESMYHKKSNHKKLLINPLL